jgi:hypothetical protein
LGGGDLSKGQEAEWQSALVTRMELVHDIVMILVTIDGVWIDSRNSVTVFTTRCLVAASNGGRSLSSGFPNYHRSKLPASHSNSSQLNLSGYLTRWLITTIYFMTGGLPQISSSWHQAPWGIQKKTCGKLE